MKKYSKAFKEKENRENFLGFERFSKKISGKVSK